MTFEQLQSVLTYVAPALAVYIGIRVDIATMKLRLDYLEKSHLKGTK
ncbi:hypothetical protein ACS5PN_03805 [Roseateles sp. NT4]